MELIFFALATVSSQDLVPQSPEAWNYVAAAGQNHIGSVYDVTAHGLVCGYNREAAVRARIEALAAAQRVHLALIAEESTAYLWSDWTLLYVEGPSLRGAVEGGRETLEPFLEAAYQAHHVC